MLRKSNDHQERGWLIDQITTLILSTPNPRDCINSHHFTMSLPRCLSAPHVGSPSTHGPPHDTRPNGHAKPKITRHSSALVVSNLASPSRPSYATTGITSATGSGHQSPRVEREEDPFSLSGFFPAQLALSNKLRVRSWKWLRSEEEEEVEGGEGEGEGLGERWYGEERMGDDDRFTGEYEVFTGYVSPVSEEDDEWIPSTPGPIFDHHSDEQTLEAIKQEDKLGILSLSKKLSHSILSSYPLS